MEINHNLILNDEQEAAFNALLESHNNSTQNQLTTEQYCSSILIGIINSEVSKRFETSLKLVGESVAPASYENRVKMVDLNTRLALLNDEEKEQKLNEILSLFNMTISTIIGLIPVFNELNKVSQFLSAKAKWSLAINIKRSSEIGVEWEKQRSELFKKHAPVNATEIKPSDEGYEKFIEECKSLLSVETDVKLLSFSFLDIVRDDLEITSDLIIKLEPLLVDTPE